MAPKNKAGPGINRRNGNRMMDTSITGPLEEAARGSLIAARDTQRAARRLRAQAVNQLSSGIGHMSVHDLLAASAQGGLGAGQKIAVGKDASGIVSQYIAPGSVDPLRLPIRDSSVKTKIYHSLQTVKLTTSNVAGSEGRFAALVRPTLGGTNGSADARVLATTASTDFSVTDWSDMSQYDQNPTVLYDENFWNANAGDYGTGTRVQMGGTATITQLMGNAPTFRTPPGGSVTNVPANFVLAQSAVICPPGALAHLSLVHDTVGGANLMASPVFGVYLDEGCTIPAVTGVDVQTSFGFHFNASSPDQGAECMVLSLNSTLYIKFEASVWIGAGAAEMFYSLSTVGITQTESSVFDKSRCIAMSVHADCVASDATNGGDVSMYFAPGGVEDQFDGPALAASLVDFDKLSSQNQHVYSGHLREGAYGWWSPESAVSRSLWAIGQVPEDLPTIMVAGIATPGIVGAGNQHVMTLYIHRIFELTTSNGFFETESSELRVADLDEAMYLLRVGDVPHVMSNGFHLDFIKKAAGAVAKYVRNPGRGGLRSDIKAVADTIQALKGAAAMVI